jgi:hypothetical protein
MDKSSVDKYSVDKSSALKIADTNAPAILIENIKKWVLYDKNLKLIAEKTKAIRDKKAELNKSICEYMNQNNMQNKRIKLPDGDLRLYEKKEYTCLSFGYIEERLGEIIQDKSHVEYIIQYLKENREKSSTLDIKRSYNNKIES